MSQQDFAPAPAPVPFLDLSGMTADVRAEVTAGWSELLDSGAFIGGTAVARFEQDWAAYCGTRHAVGVANGTDALHLTFRALGIGAGDEVVVTTNTFVATAEKPCRRIEVIRSRTTRGRSSRAARACRSSSRPTVCTTRSPYTTRCSKGRHGVSTRTDPSKRGVTSSTSS